MKLGLAAVFVVASCWVLFLQLNAQSYLFTISKGIVDPLLKIFAEPVSAFSFRIPSFESPGTERHWHSEQAIGVSSSDFHSAASSIQTSKDICFVTSEYADDAQDVDQLSIPTLANRTGFQHFLFTNLQDLKPPGWTQVITNLNFSNHIIESHFAKFLGWKFPEIQESCQIAIYIDGIYKIADKPESFQKVADHILNTPSELTFDERPGWMQFVHDLKRDGPLGELQAIAKWKKDTPEHIRRTTEWLFSNVPPDVANATEWLATIPIYLNTWIAYNPKSPHFRRLTEDFWSVYSRGTISWRDQPTWAFFVHKHGKTPLPFPGRKKTYFKLFGDYTYV